ncbi:unnamed protein product [Soboliphyme baturini]|uniref:phosphoinositide 5-phosphatase n=1 Tax=Soboliphyme baturini TaxID=241478 RepID=A0A183IJ74_9BILA|nr:unnamed protein product [Soboliphyme baturini]
MSISRTFRVYERNVAAATSIPTRTPYSLILDSSKISDEFLLFESGIVASLNNEECVEFRKAYVKILDAFACLGEFILHRPENGAELHYLCLVTSCVCIGRIEDCDVYRITDVAFVSMWGSYAAPSDGRINEIQKFLCGGTFYFASSVSDGPVIDLCLTTQQRYQKQEFGNRNRSLHLPFKRYGINTSKWLIRCICGGVEIKTVYVGHQQAKACLISRLSCERMGTRFNVRGVNDFGHVANFVESEQVLFFNRYVVSFLQTRGSVPLFWEQPGVQVGSHRVKMSRGFEASAPAYDRHFFAMRKYYKQVAIVNLLGAKEGEAVLSSAYKLHHKASVHGETVPLVNFDFHSEVHMSTRVEDLAVLLRKMKPVLEKFGFCVVRDKQVLRHQRGVLRVNCLDCLDRSNAVQTFFGLHILSEQLKEAELADKANIVCRFEEVFKEMWTANGDGCSKIYAGTGALEGKSKIKDASRSVSRTIQNNLLDASKQAAIDAFLLSSGFSAEVYDLTSCIIPMGLMLANPSVLSTVVEQRDKFTIPETVRVFCGTWNVNGGQRPNSVALLDISNDFTAPNDIYAIGLEEIVDLNATNIVSASSANQKMWIDAYRRILCEGKCKYILLESVQLVGVCLFVFIRPRLAPFVRDLATDMVKTGFGGAVGNKGGVAIRFLLHCTPLCFVCSHFAAGQMQVQERNSDFAEISRKLQFPMVVFWLGDFNYRIDLPCETVKDAAKAANWELLRSADQLNVQRSSGNVFNDFEEGLISFAPTYKYDTYSDDYDTSEKCRIPAWTDRVLWWERIFSDRPKPDPCQQKACKLLLYARAELKTSDHRPVGAIFDLEVRKMDFDKFESVYHDVLTCMGPPDATVIITVDSASADSDMFPHYIVDQVLQKVAQLCIQVLLVKFVGKEMWLIFKDGEMALAALSMDKTQVNSKTLNVRLKSTDWESEAERELKNARCVDSNLASELLDEGRFSTPTLDVYEEEVICTHVDNNLSAVKVPETFVAVDSKPVPPRRPPPPKFSKDTLPMPCSDKLGFRHVASVPAFPDYLKEASQADRMVLDKVSVKNPPLHSSVLKENLTTRSNLASISDDDWAKFTQARCKEH